MSTLNELERLMRETGAAIRAIPEKSRSVFENSEKNRRMFPDGTAKYLPEYGRVMLVVEKKMQNGGKFLLEMGRHIGTSTTVRFSGKQYFNTLSDIMKELAKKTAPEKEHLKRIDVECWIPGVNTPLLMTALFDDRDLTEDEARRIIQADPMDVCDNRMVVMPKALFQKVFRSLNR